MVRRRPGCRQRRSASKQGEEYDEAKEITHFQPRFGVRFEFVCIKKQFVLCILKMLSPLYALDD
jgi:hypothetical protein